jgi:hypothetical protein
LISSSLRPLFAVRLICFLPLLPTAATRVAIYA